MKKIEEFMEKIRQKNVNNIYIYGAGTYGKIVARLFEKYGVNWNGFIDKKLAGTSLYDKYIYAIDNMALNSGDCVLISLSDLIYKKEIYDIENQLLERGILQGNVLKICEDVELVNEMVYEVNEPRECLRRNKIFENKYKNKRCFIIGNGPSLALNDLERLQDEVTFACNGIIELFDKTSWRPTYFFCEDSIFLKNHIPDENSLKNILANCEYVVTTVRSDLFQKYGTKYANLYYCYAIKLANEVKFSDDITEKIYSLGTTLYSIMQFAVYTGVKEIYLLGVDHSFRKEIHKNGAMIVNQDIENHMRQMEQVNEGVYHVDLIMEGYMCAQEYASKHGIKIYNATRGGKLEVFERVDFDKLF